MKKDKLSEIKIKKNKKKLSKVQIIRIVFFCLSFVLFILATIFNTIKIPIEGSIYKLNTTRHEREKIYEEEYNRLFDIYENSFEASDYENQVQNSSFIELLYKYSYQIKNNGTKNLIFELINNSKLSVMSMYSIIFKNRENSMMEYTIRANERILFSNASETYILNVPSDFDINDYVIFATNVKYDNSIYDSWHIDSYENELERTKNISISLMIRNQIGERPTIENEELEPMPEYLRAINKNNVRCVLMYFFAVIFAIIGIIFIFYKKFNFNLKTKNNQEFYINRSDNQDFYINKNSNQEILEDIKDDLKEEILEEIKKETQNKKVVCIHCGSRYNDNLDECPNCGSAKIDEE